MSFAAFLLYAIGVSLSGVLAPGAVTAATIAAGVRRPHAGALIALGHGLVEMPLVVLILVGLGAFLQQGPVGSMVALAGGGFLILMGAEMLLEAGFGTATPPDAANPATRLRGPFAAGVLLSATNPYFLLWWASAGLAMARQARTFGLLAFGVFALTHWLCDLVWLEILSYASFRGARIFGRRSQHVVTVVCGLAMMVFGAIFIRFAFTPPG